MLPAGAAYHHGCVVGPLHQAHWAPFHAMQLVSNQTFHGRHEHRRAAVVGGGGGQSGACGRRDRTLFNVRSKRCIAAWGVHRPGGHRLHLCNAFHACREICIRLRPGAGAARASLFRSRPMQRKRTPGTAAYCEALTSSLLQRITISSVSKSVSIRSPCGDRRLLCISNNHQLDYNIGSTRPKLPLPGNAL